MRLEKYLKTFLKVQIIVIVGFVYILISSHNLFAQFGQNKVQYKKFDWSFIQSKHFDIYFNQGGDYLAQYTAVIAEASLDTMQKNIGYQIKNRVPIIIFNSHDEFQQNNVIDEYLPEGVGGVTELFKNRVTIPFEGDYNLFRHVIAHELLHAYMNDMYYGGSIQNIITRNIKLQFPSWFSEGMAEYQSLRGMDKANDMFIRDAIIYDYLPPIDYIGGYLSYRGGQAFFAWLADEYGKEKIGDMMQQIKATGDVDEGFKDVYKLDLEKLSKKWHKALKQEYWPDISTRQEVTDFATRLTNHREESGYYNTGPALSPKGDKIAFISNRDDYFDVFIADAKKGGIIKKLISGNKTSNFEELHLLTPGICWSPDGSKIVVAVKSGDKDAMYIVDVESEDMDEIPMDFDGIFSAEWNATNNSIVFVGDNSKQSDIWVYNVTGKKLEQITNDVFSDQDPTWSNDGKEIYFTSDRGDYTDPNGIPENFNMADFDYSEKDLYVYDVEAKTINRFLGDKNANESHVVFSEDGKKILYISDKNGISNIYTKNLETGEVKPITNSIDPIVNLSLSRDGKKVAFTALNNGGYDIFYINNPFEVDLKMKELINTPFVEHKYYQNSDSSGIALKKLELELKGENGELDSVGPNFKNMLTKKDSSSIYGNDISLNLNPNTIDTAKMQKPGLKLKERSEFQITDNKNPDGSLRINKYKIKFSPDIIYSNVGYSSFFGVQGVAQMSFSDILGNHRIYLATSLVLDLKNSDYAVGYYYLPKRINYGIEAYHSARFLLITPDNINYNLYRFSTYGVNFVASYPLSKFDRFDLGIAGNTIAKENLDDPNQPSEGLQFILPSMGYVHDNTLFGSTAPIRGTRYNLSIMGSPKFGADGVSFFSAMGDYRTYFRFFNDYNFVWRLNGGLSVGRDPQRFYIGGTPNWINYTVQNDILPIEDIKDYAFATPVMPMRGFDYNYRSGSKFLLMNNEFRFPLFRYLIFGPLPLAFQNIQGVLFTDLGSVWSNTKKLQLISSENGKPITQDLLAGVGFGVRIFLLYFPLKFDVAWSYNLQKFSMPIFYFSLGSDF
ncbi:MAG: peptidase MA family metallohydrolase [Ignavibacteria bacterium]